MIRYSEPEASPDLLYQLRLLAQPLRDDPELGSLHERIGQASVVALGEASHGTSEYYSWRTRISKKLIEDKKFSFIAVEGDWPDCFLINQYIKGRLDISQSARRVLSTFERWPTWMWANEEVIDLIEWLKVHNDPLPEKEKAGFYGLDVYSLWQSLGILTQHLREHDPDSLEHINQVMRCFEHYEDEPADYARAMALGKSTCERVVHALVERLHQRPQPFEKAFEGHLQAEQNAWVLKNAEAYYRALVEGRSESWNVRDLHMADTFDRLMKHHGVASKGILWEHNTHIGDARFTDMLGVGEINVGQVLRERYREENVFLLGFSSYQGSVIAGLQWDAPMQTMKVPEARKGSWEEILHRVSAADKLLIFPSAAASDDLLAARGHRAIGVIYRPDQEHLGNYVPTMLPRRYDALIYLDQTEALHPLSFNYPSDL